MSGSGARSAAGKIQRIGQPVKLGSDIFAISSSASVLASWVTKSSRNLPRSLTCRVGYQVARHHFQPLFDSLIA